MNHILIDTKEGKAAIVAGRPRIEKMTEGKISKNFLFNIFCNKKPRHTYHIDARYILIPIKERNLWNYIPELIGKIVTY